MRIIRKTNNHRPERRATGLTFNSPKDLLNRLRAQRDEQRPSSDGENKVTTNDKP